jgi:hypothetical protein
VVLLFGLIEARRIVFMKTTQFNLILIFMSTLACAAPLQAQASQSETADRDESNIRPSVAEVDLKIVRRAREILDSPSKWNHADTRECLSGAKTFSLYCALKKATEELDSKFEHRSAAMQEARFVIDEIGPNSHRYEHRLMDYNNDPSTKFSDIQNVLALLEERIKKRLSEKGSAKSR